MIVVSNTTPLSELAKVLISKVQPILDELIVAGKRISSELYREVLAIANE